MSQKHTDERLSGFCTREEEKEEERRKKCHQASFQSQKDIFSQQEKEESRAIEKSPFLTDLLKVTWGSIVECQ